MRWRPTVFNNLTYQLIVLLESVVSTKVPRTFTRTTPLQGEFRRSLWDCLFCKFASTWPAWKNVIQNTMPQKEKLAISKTAYIIFPWQVERILHLNFPGEVSRAWEAGFVSCNMCLTMQEWMRSLTVHRLIKFSTHLQGYMVKLQEIATVNVWHLRCHHFLIILTTIYWVIHLATESVVFNIVS